MRHSLVLLGLVLWIAGLPLAVHGEPLDRAKAKADTENHLLWFDARDLRVEGKGWNDTESFYDRLPARAKDKVPPNVWMLSHQSAGLYVRFDTNAREVRVRWTLLQGSPAMTSMPIRGAQCVDLYARDPDGRWRFTMGRLKSGKLPTPTDNEALFSEVSGRPCLLYLPISGGVTSVEIGIPEETTITVPEDPEIHQRKPIVFYGTSVTHGGLVSRPGMACPALVQRRLNLPVLNLGFSGSGKMEPAMAEILAELDPSVYVLDCLWNMDAGSVAERVEPFVHILRAAHPDTPIVLAEDSNYRHLDSTEKGRVLMECYQKLQAAGVRNIHFLSGKDMLGDDGDGTVDGCHLNDLGASRQADYFAKALIPILELKDSKERTPRQATAP